MIVLTMILTMMLDVLSDHDNKADSSNVITDEKHDDGDEWRWYRCVDVIDDRFDDEDVHNVMDKDGDAQNFNEDLRLTITDALTLQITIMTLWRWLSWCSQANRKVKRRPW